MLAPFDVPVSRLALGTMTFGAEADERESGRMLDAFTGAGGTLIDTADVYTHGVSEEIVGRWLSRRGGPDGLLIATKGRFPMPGQGEASLRADYLRRALDASLRRLGLGRVDLYQAHGPDSSTPLDELATFAAEAVRAGKISGLGVSNLTGWEITRLAGMLAGYGLPLVTVQPQYSLLVRETEWEIIPATIAAGAGSLVWGPMAAGWLTGKYARDTPPPRGSRLGDDPDRGLEAWSKRATERTWRIVDVLRDVAAAESITMAQAALAWVCARPGVSAAIVGARTVDQLQGSLGAGEARLSEDATARLDEVSAPPTPDYPYAFIEEMAQRR